MASSFVSVFCKRISCPSSQTLLAFRRSRLGCGEKTYVEGHLDSCDFCSAELQLLKRHRYEAEESKVVEIPSNVRRLAESLFVKTRTLSRINNVVVYSGPLSH